MPEIENCDKKKIFSFQIFLTQKKIVFLKSWIGAGVV